MCNRLFFIFFFTKNRKPQGSSRFNNLASDFNFNVSNLLIMNNNQI